MNEPTYKAARIIAATVADHFRRHIAAARAQGEERLAPEPDEATIAAIIDAAFWASLRREEGMSPKISLAFAPPEEVDQPIVFENRLALTTHFLTKLAPAVERPEIHLGVWHENAELYVWGATRTVPSFCFVLEVIEPGLLVIKHRRADGFGKFANVAVLKGDQVKVIDENGTSLPDCPELLTSLLAFTSPWDQGQQESVNLLVQLSASMRAHGHGGSLLVIPAGTEHWRESIVHPILYSVVPPYTGLTDLMKQDVKQQSERLWQTAMRRAVDTVAGLTAVDGATVISDQYELLAFGAKIRRAAHSKPVEEIITTEPVVGDHAAVVHAGQTGGTRHMSAAQFVYDCRDAMALVASQDGRFTIFAWSPCENMVHAHRVDTLLL
jgi:hypothetical protein